MFQNNKNQEPEQEQNKKSSRWVMSGHFFIIFLLTIFVVQLFTLQLGSSSMTIPYSDFLTYVREGNVARLTMEGQKITGEFTEPVENPDAKEAPDWFPLKAKEATTTADAFTTTLPLAMIVSCRCLKSMAYK